MMGVRLEPVDVLALRERFGARVQVHAPLARYTAARLGGPAEVLFEAETLAELENVVRLAWSSDWPLVVLGGGSNVLVSDQGVRGLVVINRARQVRFDLQADPPTVYAESGANFGLLARQAARHGLSGLEWAAGIPGTLGGAVVGNAGAHSGDMAGNLLLAEILQRAMNRLEAAWRETWTVEQLEYTYRSSLLKRQSARQPGSTLVLAARLRLAHSTPESVQARSDELVAYRKRTQPPGASLGSIFKNPPGDYAGRLIEAAGLKGARIGGAQISPVHANFFINLGNASASDLRALIRLAQETVSEKLGVDLDPEIELFGEW